MIYYFFAKSTFFFLFLFVYVEHNYVHLTRDVEQINNYLQPPTPHIHLKIIIMSSNIPELPVMIV
jgi:hypothetical protein